MTSTGNPATQVPSSAARFPAATRHHNFLFTSGLAAVDPATLLPRSAGFDDQCRDVLAQLDVILDEYGCHRTDVLKLECYLTSRADFSAWNASFATYFLAEAAEGAEPPARTTLISQLPIEGLLIEIQAIARM